VGSLKLVRSSLGIYVGLIAVFHDGSNVFWKNGTRWVIDLDFLLFKIKFHAKSVEIEKKSLTLFDF